MSSRFVRIRTIPIQTRSLRIFPEPCAIARASRESHSLTLAVLDLDAFQTFNDVHGHRAGDELLRQVASLWRSHLRAVDHLARFASDQFVALFPDANAPEAVAVLERLRAVMPMLMPSPPTRKSHIVAMPAPPPRQ